MSWIDVNKELPKEHGYYLVFAPKSFPKNCRSLVAEFYIDDKEGFWYSEASEEHLEDVTYWTKIPPEPF